MTGSSGGGPEVCSEGGDVFGGRSARTLCWYCPFRACVYVCPRQRCLRTKTRYSCCIGTMIVDHKYLVKRLHFASFSSRFFFPVLSKNINIIRGFFHVDHGATLIMICFVSVYAFVRQHTTHPRQQVCVKEAPGTKIITLQPSTLFLYVERVRRSSCNFRKV